jgi:hypothetical protein
MPLPAAFVVSVAPSALGALVFCSHAATNKAATVMARRDPLLFCIGGGASLEYVLWANTMGRRVLAAETTSVPSRCREMAHWPKITGADR